MKSSPAIKTLEKAERKKKRKAKIKAKIKLAVQKRLETLETNIKTFQSKLELLKEDIQSVNPRMHAFQPHTKDKWLGMLEDLINDCTRLAVSKPSK